jgi:hypothetical protein
LQESIRIGLRTRETADARGQRNFYGKVTGDSYLLLAEVLSDEEKLPETEAAYREARTLLQAELNADRSLLEKEPDKTGADVHYRMQQWQEDSNLSVVRGESALAKLPQAERQAWQALWMEVEALKEKAAATNRVRGDGK